jgi:hypothetical protein
MVFGTYYASLDEAWGVPSFEKSATPPNAKSKSHNHNNHNHNDDEDEDRHPRSKKSRSANPLHHHPPKDNATPKNAKKKSPRPSSSSEMMVHSVKEEAFENIMDRYDFQARFDEYASKREDEEEDENVIPSSTSSLEPSSKASFPVIESFEDTDTERQYLNFATYVFSGIVLIFVLEQFIQIGIAIRGSR